MKFFLQILSVAICVCGTASAGELSKVTVAALSDQPSTEGSRSTDLTIIQPNNQNIKTVDFTAHESDIWGRIRKGFALPDLQNSVVDEQLAQYEAHPQRVNALLSRSSKYLYHVVTELEKRGMPTELALLPLVESAYNPMAMSPAHAVGLWQFIPSTGRTFNLTQNWWIDQRRDVVASTNAALDYLQSIYEMHGDWQLALASYNWGENAVARAINKNIAAGKTTDYSNLTMPDETRIYVPRLQALKNIISHPEQYGITLPDVPNEPYFTEVKKPKGIDVAIAAKLAEMPISDFQALNPSYNRPVIPGVQGTALVLPIANAEKFKENLAQNNAPLSNWRTYSLPRTARVDEIARGLQMAVQSLIAVNGLSSARTKLASGYTLLIPTAAAERLHEMLTKTPAPAEPSHKKRYRSYHRK